MRFRDRDEAGRQLAKLLLKYRKLDPIVLGIPRGGIPVAFQVANALNAALDVRVVRKLGCPGHPEYGLGAVAEGDVVHVDRSTSKWAGASHAEIDAQANQKKREVFDRVARYRDGWAAPELLDRTVILVDDGLATGSSMWAAVQSVLPQRPRQIIVAAPVAEAGVVAQLRALVDEVHVLEQPKLLLAIGAHYDNFTQTSEEDVLALIRRSRGEGAVGQLTTPGEAARPQEVTVQVDGVELEALLVVPAAASGLVIFSHGSGSGRFSARNRLVAAELRRRGFATVLLDLLTTEEEKRDALSGELRFNIDFFAPRLAAATDWAINAHATRGLPVGLFGASIGAAAALMVAARRPHGIQAVVTRGGRVDLAARHLAHVRAPTLMIAGGLDHNVVALNERALDKLDCEKELEVIPGASHLFEESGALEKVGQLAAEWFSRHLCLPPLRVAQSGQLVRTRS